jgi:methanogenic corrinoid protein MtbC1
MVELRQCVQVSEGWINRGEGHAKRDGSGAWQELPRQLGDWQVRLLTLIEGEIIPRLMMTHKVVAKAASSQVTMPGEAQVLKLARMVLSHDLTEATKFLEEMRGQGIPIDALLLDLLAPAARYLGELWEQDLCSFLDVTVGLSRLQMLLNELDPAAVGETVEPVARRRILLMPTPGEQHTFGIKMVEKFFVGAGWEVWGAAHAGDDVVDLCQREWFAIVGLSLATEPMLNTLSAAIRAIRRVSCNASIQIMVGGPLFVQRPDLVNLIGADATAADGQLAVLLGQQMVVEQLKLRPATANR